MAAVKFVAEWMAERGVTFAALVEATGLDKRVVEAVTFNRYTPSPQQRQMFADALGVEVEQIAWEYLEQVSPIYGHGPQFGRSP